MSPAEIIQGLFIIYVGKVEQIRYHWYAVWCVSLQFDVTTDIVWEAYVV